MELYIDKKEENSKAVWSESNFVEYPYFKLGKKNSQDSEIKIEIETKEGVALWHVQNRDGLPGILSYEVFTALELQLEKYGISEDGLLYFSILDIMKILGWKGRGGTDYKAIKDAIDKIVDTKISANLTLIDKSLNKKERYRNFRLLTEFEMTTVEYPDGRKQDLCAVRFNTTYMNNRKQGYVSPISVNTFFYTLKSPVAKRLYQYLNKRAFYMAKRGDLFSISAFELATLMGLKAKYAADIKKSLAKAHKELIAIGFLKSVELVKHSVKHQEFQYAFNQEFQKLETKERKEATLKLTHSNSECLQELIQYGIKRELASKMVAQSLSRVKLVIEHIKQQEQSGGKINNPAGFIYSFMKEEWELPATSSSQVVVSHYENRPDEPRYDTEEEISEEEVEAYKKSLSKDAVVSLLSELFEFAEVEQSELKVSIATIDTLDIFDGDTYFYDTFTRMRLKVMLDGFLISKMKKLRDAELFSAE